MSGPVFIDGENICLRTFEKDDLEFIQKNVNKPDMRRPLFGHSPANFEQEEKFYEKTRGKNYDVLIVSSSNQNLGLVALRKDEGTENAEITVWLTEKAQGNGFGEEAVKLMTEFGFEELDYHRIYARILESNKPSKNLFEKIGYKKEGSKREAFYTRDRYEDIEIYSVLHREWNS